MLGVTIKDKIRTQILDNIKIAPRLKWKWMGHVASR